MIAAATAKSAPFVWRNVVKENEGKLSSEDKLMIEEELKSAEGVLERNRDAGTPDELRAAFEKLQTAAHRLAESMYKQAGGAPGGDPNAGDPSAPKDSDVIDAEFEDKS